MKEIIVSGAIGEMKTLKAEFGFDGLSIPRLVEPSLAGGALLDMGIYPLTQACIAFGSDFKNISSSAVLSDKGVDMQHHIVLTYEDGKMANLIASLYTKVQNGVDIYGTKGKIRLEDICCPTAMTVTEYESQKSTTYQLPIDFNGFEYELASTVANIQGGKIECDTMPHQEILHIMEVMDGLRKSWGVVYPTEKKAE